VRQARLSVLALIALAVIPARAQQDDRGSKDHPLFPRLPGYFIVDHEGPDPSGSYEFEVNKDEPKKVTGTFWHLSYKIKDGETKASPVRIGRTYTQVIVKRGGTRIWERFDDARGGTAAMLPPAEAGGVGTLWLQVDITGGGQFYDVYIVEEKGSVVASAFRRNKYNY
jgi:hypothetical protein